MMFCRWRAVEVNNSLSPFLWLHWFFTADDITGIDAPAHLIYRYSKTTYATFINITLLYTLLGNLLSCFLLNHDFLLYVENNVTVSVSRDLNSLSLLPIRT